MVQGIALASGAVFALVWAWTSIDRRYSGAAPDGDGPCAGGHRCLFCSCGRPRAEAKGANGGRG